jgi:transcriptional regulator with XRE-family HTH domain
VLSSEVNQDIDIAGRIFSERYKRDWSQSELARRSGVDRATISKVEAAHSTRMPHVDTLRRLAAAFEVPLSELLKEGPVTIVVDGEEKKLGRVLPPRSKRSGA